MREISESAGEPDALQSARASALSPQSAGQERCLPQRQLHAKSVEFAPVMLLAERARIDAHAGKARILPCLTEQPAAHFILDQTGLPATCQYWQVRLKSERGGHRPIGPE